jgi:hypothetical protein
MGYEFGLLMGQPMGGGEDAGAENPLSATPTLTNKTPTQSVVSFIVRYPRESTES